MGWKKIIMLGIALAFISYVMRMFTLPFGIHTIIQMIFLLLALILFGNGDFSLSLIASLLSILVLVIIEFVCLSLLMPVFGVTPETLFENLVIRIMITEPQVFIMFILAFLINKLIRKEVG